MVEGDTSDEVGAPVAVAPVVDFSFADAEGTGSQLCAGVGFAGSSGGALRLFFGTDDAGWECKTSLCNHISTQLLCISFEISELAHPADIRVQEAPPDPVFTHFFHLSTPIQEHAQHALAEFDDCGIFLRLRWLCRVIGHCMFLGNRGDHQRRVKTDKRLAK